MKNPIYVMFRSVQYYWVYIVFDIKQDGPIT